MKRIILILFSMLLLAACVPTPDEPIVIGKDQRPMIEQAKETPSAEPEPTPITKTVSETFSGNGVTVNLNATVTGPGGDMPIVRVHGTDFDQETVDRFWNILVGDTAMYPYQPETKRDIAKRIEQEQKAIDELEAQKTRGESYDAELLELCYDDLNTLKEMYKTAPEGSELIPIGSLLNVRDDGVRLLMAFEHPDNWVDGDGKKFDVLNNLPKPYGKGKPQTFGASLRYTALSAHSDDDFFGDIEERELRPIAITDEAPEGAKLSLKPTEAMQRASEWIERLGVPFAPIRLTLVRDRSKRQAYLVECGRVVNGIPSAPMSGYSRSEAQDAVAVDWFYETFQMLLSDDGLLALRWESPVEVEDTVVERSNLLPFDDVLAIFRKMMPIQYASSYDDRFESFEIDEVRLELVRVLEQNAKDTGLFIPVWNFYGTRNFDEPGWNGDPIYGCHLMINAVNGSIIDAERGY